MNNDKPQTIINLNFAPYSATTTETVHPDGSKTVTTTTTVSPLLLDAPQTAALLSVSLRTLQSLTDLGRIPVHYVGSSPRYVLGAVAEALFILPRSPEPKSLQLMAKEAAAEGLRAAALRAAA